MKKLFLLDAYALIFRAYYAFIKNPRINSKGLNTSAILGFVNTLEEVLNKEKPSHIGIAFDPAGPTFRHEAYEKYKAQREETPEGIRTAVPYIKEIIRAYHIPILEVAGYEADDVISPEVVLKHGEGNARGYRYPKPCLDLPQRYVHRWHDLGLDREYDRIAASGLLYGIKDLYPFLLGRCLLGLLPCLVIHCHIVIRIG